MRTYIWVMRRIAPRRAVLPPAVARTVGVIGTAGGLALGWLLPGGSTLRQLLGVGAGVGAGVLAQRG